MKALVDMIQASPQARERTKVIFETLSREGSVQEGCARLGIARTRFQDLRRRLMRGAVGALEERPSGRPRRPRESAGSEREALARRVAELEHELRRTQAELTIARSTAAAPVSARLAAKERRR